MTIDHNTRLQWHYYTINVEKGTSSRHRCIKYKDVDFDALAIEITASGKSRYFAIPATILPRTADSINFTYYSPYDIRWSPEIIGNYVEELDPEFATQFSLRHNFPILSNESDYSLVRNGNEEKDDIYKTRKKTIRNWIIVIIILSLFYTLFSDNNSKAGLSQAEAQSGVKVFLKYNYLTDPKSYHSEGFTNVRLNTASNTYFITHTYRAKNGFGGYVRETQIFELDSKGNVINHY